MFKSFLHSMAVTVKQCRLKPATRAAETGRSMVEMIVVLAIIGVLSITGILGYQYAMEMHRENETLDRFSKAVAGARTGRLLETHGWDTAYYLDEDNIEQQREEYVSYAVDMHEVISNVGDDLVDGLNVATDIYGRQSFMYAPLEGPYKDDNKQRVEIWVQVETPEAFSVHAKNLTLGACRKIVMADLGQLKTYRRTWEKGSDAVASPLTQWATWDPPASGWLFPSDLDTTEEAEAFCQTVLGTQGDAETGAGANPQVLSLWFGKTAGILGCSPTPPDEDPGEGKVWVCKNIQKKPETQTYNPNATIKVPQSCCPPKLNSCCALEDWVAESTSEGYTEMENTPHRLNIPAGTYPYCAVVINGECVVTSYCNEAPIAVTGSDKLQMCPSCTTGDFTSDEFNVVTDICVGDTIRKIASLEQGVDAIYTVDVSVFTESGNCAPCKSGMIGTSSGECCPLGSTPWNSCGPGSCGKNGAITDSCGREYLTSDACCGPKEPFLGLCYNHCSELTFGHIYRNYPIGDREKCCRYSAVIPDWEEMTATEDCIENAVTSTIAPSYNLTFSLEKTIAGNDGKLCKYFTNNLSYACDDLTRDGQPCCDALAVGPEWLKWISSSNGDTEPFIGTCCTYNPADGTISDACANAIITSGLASSTWKDMFLIPETQLMPYLHNNTPIIANNEGIRTHTISEGVRLADRAMKQVESDFSIKPSWEVDEDGAFGHLCGKTVSGGFMTQECCLAQYGSSANWTAQASYPHILSQVFSGFTSDIQNVGQCCAQNTLPVQGGCCNINPYINDSTCYPTLLTEADYQSFCENNMNGEWGYRLDTGKGICCGSITN